MKNFITFEDLVVGTSKVLPSSLDKIYGVRVINTRISDFVGTKMKVFTSSILSSEKDKSYTTTIAFYDLEDPENAIPDLSKCKCAVRCSCDCYYYWYSYANRQAKCNYGARFAPYIPVSPPSGRKPLNPHNIPGCCKHVMHLVQALKSQGLVV